MAIVDGTVALLLLGFLLFCLLDVLTTSRARIRPLPRMVWALAVVLLNPVGGMVWLVFGRPRSAAGDAPRPEARRSRTHPAGTHPSGRAPERGPRPGRSSAEQRRGSVPPDDDPEFLDRLARRISEQRDEPYDD